MGMRKLVHRPSLQTAVAYARVSSRDQEKEGFSIPAQKRLLHEYAAAKDIRIVQEFVDVETARRSGRDGFGQMLAYLKKRERSCRAILVEKTDRLYRNIKDWATLDELGLDIHFVKENVIISPEAKSAEQFMHGIKVLMARNYSQNLGEETIKGMTEKARMGMYPSFAPIGYRNVDGPNGKRIIVPDDDAPTVARLFELFATDQYSIESLANLARREGLTLREKPIYKSALHLLLRKRLYTGDFDWNGTTYQGTHEPLVIHQTWNAVQELLDKRRMTKVSTKRVFTFTGLVQCGHCGCMMVGEIKKARYVYWHCTGHRGKCPEPYTKDETLTREFARVLQELVIPKEVLAWLAEEVVATDRTQAAARQSVIRRKEQEVKRLQTRIETMYLDKLDGKITAEFFEEKAGDWREQQQHLRQSIEAMETTPLAPIEEAVDLVTLTSQSCHLFLAQAATEQRRLLTTILERATWKNGRLAVVLLEPFEQLRRSNQVTINEISSLGSSVSDPKIWLLR